MGPDGYLERYRDTFYWWLFLLRLAGFRPPSRKRQGRSLEERVHQALRACSLVFVWYGTVVAMVTVVRDQDSATANRALQVTGATIQVWTAVLATAQVLYMRQEHFFRLIRMVATTTHHRLLSLPKRDSAVLYWLFLATTILVFSLLLFSLPIVRSDSVEEVSPTFYDLWGYGIRSVPSPFTKT